MEDCFVVCNIIINKSWYFYSNGKNRKKQPEAGVYGVYTAESRRECYAGLSFDQKSLE